GVDAGESIVVDLFGNSGGSNYLGTVYAGPFVSMSANCRAGGSLCSDLLDGDFSVGLRMTGGAAMLTPSVVDAWTPREPRPIQAAQAVASPVAATVPEPGSLPLVAAALALAACVTRTRVSGRPRTTSR